MNEKGFEKAVESIRALEESITSAIFGKRDVVRLAIAGLLARGHLLIEDVPGIGKTTLARAIRRPDYGHYKGRLIVQRIKYIESAFSSLQYCAI